MFKCWSVTSCEKKVVPRVKNTLPIRVGLHCNLLLITPKAYEKKTDWISAPKSPLEKANIKIPKFQNFFKVFSKGSWPPRPVFTPPYPLYLSQNTFSYFFSFDNSVSTESGRYRRKKTWKIQDFSFFVVNLSLDHKPFLLIFIFEHDGSQNFKIFSKYFSCSKLILPPPELFFLTKNILPTFVFGICWFYKLSTFFQNLLFVF